MLALNYWKEIIKFLFVSANHSVQLYGIVT